MVSRFNGRGEAGLAVLALLAGEAPMRHVDELVRLTHRQGAPSEAIAEVTAARALAQEVHDRFGRRRRREAGLSALVDLARDLIAPDDPGSLPTTLARRARLL
ncbi:MAG: hypothetical protein HOV94_00660, partial [Saccharothrix sp.]|nr:hypothetical protein [Saccharothrix sp.]